MPFSERVAASEGALPHLLPNNCSWLFYGEAGAANEFHIPMFQRPYGSGVLNPEFVRLFTILFRGVMAYLDKHGCKLYISSWGCACMAHAFMIVCAAVGKGVERRRCVRGGSVACVVRVWRG